jgi:hypothetical protein
MTNHKKKTTAGDVNSKCVREVLKPYAEAVKSVPASCCIKLGCIASSISFILGWAAFGDIACLIYKNNWNFGRAGTLFLLGAVLILSGIWIHSLCARWYDRATQRSHEAAMFVLRTTRGQR